MKSNYSLIVVITLLANCILSLLRVGMPGEPLFFGTEPGYSSWVFATGMLITCFTGGYILIQAILAACYRPVPDADVRQLPKCSILIPAYNEGRQVCAAIESVLASNFPAEKMEIIAIDDGSADDTWYWLNVMAERSGGRVRLLRQEVNSGKKRALCRGIEASSAEIIVTIDSDSSLEPGALTALLSPFVNDPKIGAVAGNIRVRNMRKGLMPRMLDVAFVFGCDFMRSAQSVIGYVLCTPGAVSAYRRSAVTPLIPAWLDQSFLGAPATIGEDRALTSLLLRNSWRVICQNNAVAHTEVPESYGKLCRMLLRWTRGDLRESIMLMDFVFTHWSLRNWKWSLFQLNIFSQIIGVLLPLVFIPCTLFGLFIYKDHLLFALYFTLSINALWSLLPAAVYGRRSRPVEALWAFVYGLFSAIALSWICVYSLFTLRNSGWLTRSK